MKLFGQYNLQDLISTFQGVFSGITVSDRLPAELTDMERVEGKRVFRFDYYQLAFFLSEIDSTLYICLINKDTLQPIIAIDVALIGKAKS